MGEESRKRDAAILTRRDSGPTTEGTVECPDFGETQNEGHFRDGLPPISEVLAGHRNERPVTDPLKGQALLGQSPSECAR